MDDTDAPPTLVAPRAPVEPPPPGVPPRHHRWVPWAVGVALVLVLAVLAAAAFVHVPYVIISPGEATALDGEVLQVDGAATYPHDGELLFLTVAVSNRDPNLYRYLFAKLDGESDVQKRQSVIGCAGYEESGRLARDQMDQSQDIAKTVALRRLGYDVPPRPSRVQVIDVVCDGPSAGRLQLGDVIVAVDGTPVTTADEVRPLIVAKRPGDTVEFAVERAGVRQTVPVELGKRPKPPPARTGEEKIVDPDAGAGYAGIISQTDRRHDIPVAVSIDTARVSGPSAGLAFSLAIIDDLTEGNLTGRGDVAVTGTINEDGSVGPVGGVAQKAVAAREAGARLMLVPADEVADARAHAGAMKVVGVRTLDDALAALARAGGTGVPAVTAAG
ncbi:MAG: PDZ domain-containing protein [Actinobacteria bacterium]|nr:PDZ domain-containing protein [Actinomycetota bacterium]